MSPFTNNCQMNIYSLSLARSLEIIIQKRTTTTSRSTTRLARSWSRREGVVGLINPQKAPQTHSRRISTWFCAIPGIMVRWVSRAERPHRPIWLCWCGMNGDKNPPFYVSVSSAPPAPSHTRHHRLLTIWQTLDLDNGRAKKQTFAIMRIKKMWLCIGNELEPAICELWLLCMHIHTILFVHSSVQK